MKIAQLVVTSYHGAEKRLARYGHGFTHLVSINEPNIEPVRGRETVPQVLALFFDDATRWREGYTLPSEEHIHELLVFAKTLNPSSRLLVHCAAGISRSTAAAYIILADRYGSGREAEALAEVFAAQVDTWGGPAPNELMVELADRLLRREGRLTRERELARHTTPVTPYGSGY